WVIGRGVGELQEMFQDTPRLAAHGIAFVSPHRLDLLGDVLAVEAVIAGLQHAQHLGLVLGPGVEIVFVAGSVRHPTNLESWPIMPDQVGSGACSPAAEISAARR